MVHYTINTRSFRQRTPDYHEIPQPDVKIDLYTSMLPTASQLSKFATSPGVVPPSLCLIQMPIALTGR